MTHKLFPLYDGELPALTGFADDSFRNDACPSLFDAKHSLKLWVDYVNPAQRECSGMRYTLCAYDAQADNYEFLFATDSVTELEEYLA